MKNTLCTLILAAVLPSTALAELRVLRGSDTLAGVMTDAIIQSGLQNDLSYQGGGSSLGEKAIIAKEQGLAAMSRAFKSEALAEASANGITPVDHVIGLDGVAVFVNASNAQAGLTISDLKNIFTCAVTTWEQLPGSTRTGAIRVLRRNDASGTTDTFKSLVGISSFGPCVTVMTETDEIAVATSEDADALAFAGLSARRDGNTMLAIGKTQGTEVQPTVANIRSGKYPLARALHVYEASGALTPSAAEKRLLERVLDRSFMDQILQDHDFITLD